LQQSATEICFAAWDKDYSVDKELSESAWLLDLGFLTELPAKLNTLNNKLQAKDQHLSHMIRAVNVFKAKLGVWTTHLNKKLMLLTLRRTKEFKQKSLTNILVN